MSKKQTNPAQNGSDWEVDYSDDNGRLIRKAVLGLVLLLMLAMGILHEWLAAIGWMVNLLLLWKLFKL